MSLKTNLFVTFFSFLIETQKCFSGFEWEYSATPHEKEVIYGISRTAKSWVYAEEKARWATVQNTIDFATVTAKVVQNITVTSVFQNDMNKTHIDLNLDKDVPRIWKAHIVKSSNICLFTC